MAVLHRRPGRQDGVDIVAVSLQAHLVEPAASLHSDETFLRKDAHRLHHCVQRQDRCPGDGAVAGMALMGAAALTVEEVGVDQEGGGWQGQEEDLVG